MIRKWYEMYKVSDDRRFQKNKKEIRKAFIVLVMEKGYDRLTVSDIARRADINRMTFYSHYDAVEDVFTEFVDDMEADIVDLVSGESAFNIDRFLEILNSFMYQEIDFFRYVARDDKLSSFRDSFKNTISKLIRVDLKASTGRDKEEQLIVADLTATCIAYSYLDWLAGEYGKIPLSKVTGVTKELLKDKLDWISYA